MYLARSSGDESARDLESTQMLSPRSDSEEEDSEDDDVYQAEPHALDDDTFGMSVCALTRDTYFCAKHGLGCNRSVRIFSTLLLAFFTLGMQVFLLEKVKQFVSAKAVHDIRIAYSDFQNVMYDCATIPTNCHKTDNGKWRGNSKDLFPSLEVAEKRLKAMGTGAQDDICRIPLSQPYFFGVVLLLWVLTCFHETRSSTRLMYEIVMLENVSSMKHAVENISETEGDHKMIISGMTVVLKVVIGLFMYLPRVGISLYLMWCGCRWLLATNNFGDLILNAVALEFVLMIKAIMYAALTPGRNKADLSATSIQPYPRTWSSHWCNFISTITMLPLFVLLVFLYMTYFQQVLPHYNWDVREVCSEYIKVRYAV